MPHPLLSGFCNPTNPTSSHDMCRMPGCTCSCHHFAGVPESAPAAPRVKVSLACLQGHHTAACGHLEAGGDPLADLAAARDAVDPHVAPREGSQPVHNHAWKPFADPHGLYQGKAYVCDAPLGGGCGATMDDRRVYPFGEVPDNLEPAGVQTAISDDYAAAVTTTYAGTAIDDTALPLEVELTTEERRQVIAGHLVLHPDTILETVRVIVERRLTESTVAP